jgi:hypothetical protein
MARAQRQLVNEKIKLAREQCNNPHSERTYTFIVDYGQNMELPFFGACQPGDTYYYTPLTVYNLGLVDVSHEDGDHLYCHLYKEGEGQKGGNNVASLIMKSLKKLGLLEDQESGGMELNIVFDNCPGQNKNHHVLWLVPYLIEMGYFKEVNFIFLVVGHTKNSADRRFNNLKMRFRKSNVTSFGKLYKVCNVSPFVTVWPVEDRDFRDYHTYLQLFYEKYTPLLKFHIFSCTTTPPPAATSTTGGASILCYKDGKCLEVMKRESNLDDHQPQPSQMIPDNFFHYRDEPEWWDGFPSTEEAVALRKTLFEGHWPPEDIPFREVPPHRQVEMYTKYRQHCPDEDKDKLCPKPSEAVLKSDKEDKKSRAARKKQVKLEAKMKAASTRKR